MPAMPKPVQLRSARYHLHHESSEADGAGWGTPVPLRAALRCPQLLIQVLLQCMMRRADEKAGCLGSPKMCSMTSSRVLLKMCSTKSRSPVAG